MFLNQLFALLANLVTNGARGLASGLAGSGAFTTATSTQSFVQHCLVDGFDVFSHEKSLQNLLRLRIYYTTFNTSMQSLFAEFDMFYTIIPFQFHMFKPYQQLKLINLLKAKPYSATLLIYANHYGFDNIAYGHNIHGMTHALMA